MTVSSTTNRWEYLGDGTTVAFQYTNKVFAAPDLEVYLAGVLQTLTTHYTVSGAGNPNGGNVTFGAAPGNGVEVTIIRRVSDIQETDYREHDSFPAESHEAALDRRTIVSQQQREAIDRALKWPVTEQNAPDPELPDKAMRAGRALAFDGEGRLIVATGLHQAVVSSFMETVLDDSSASDALSTLGISAFIKTLLDDPDAAAARATLAAMGATSSSVDGRVALFDGTSGALLKQAPAGALLDVGMIVPTARTVAPPGWLLCDGRNVSRTTYADLFARLATNFGAGDGSTTFGIPDLRGRVVAGKDNMGGGSADRLTNQAGGLNGDVLGATGGAETHQLIVAQIPGHVHNYSAVFVGGGDPVLTGGGGASYSTQTGVQTGSTGGDGLHNNVQPTIILNYCIFTGVA